MENAAHAAADVIKEKLGGSVAGKSFLILCGKGNNGGDGAALARILSIQAAKVRVLLLGKVEETKGDARINFEIIQNEYQQRPVNFHEVQTIADIYEIWNYYKSEIKFDVIVDAVFGTGLNRPLEGNIQFIHYYCKDYTIDNYPALWVSIDLPSGIDADSASPIGFYEDADLTVTFTSPKIANVLPPICHDNGEVRVVNIGSPIDLINNSKSKLFVAEKQDAVDWIHRTNFTSDSYKNKRGHALLIAGSNDYAGAAVLSGNAAIVSGVGLVTIAAPESSQTAIASRILPEVMTRGVAETENGAVSEDAFEEINEFIEQSIDAVAVGCGLSSSEESTKKLVRKIVEERKTPLVIDADGLNALAPFDLQGNDELPLILTPHEGEFLKLLGTKDKEVLKDRVKAVRDFAEKHKVILVLKGERVLTAAPDGRVVINPTGNSGLGKAGNGDTLTGIITGFVAQAVQMKVDIFETVIAAVYISSLAGDIAAEKFGKRVMLASRCQRVCWRSVS